MFDWDPKKARTNLSKHGVTFQQALSVFGDPMAVAFPDLEHSADEDRYITFGYSLDGLSHVAKGCCMKKVKDDAMKDEYERKDLGKGVRGMHFEKYRKHARLVVLSPDVAAEFPSDHSVDQALRAVLRQREKSSSKSR